MIEQEKKNQKIKIILKLQDSRQQYQPLLNFGINLLRKTYYDLSDDFFSNLIAEFSEDAYEELIIKLYDNVFTTIELDEIIKFLSSGVGKKAFGRYFINKQKEIGSEWGISMERKCLAEHTKLSQGNNNESI